MFVEKLENNGRLGTQKEVVIQMNAEELTHIVNALYHYEAMTDAPAKVVDTYIDAMLARDMLVYGMVQEHTIQLVNELKAKHL